MGSVTRAICVAGLLLCLVYPSALAATGQARACAEVVGPVLVCGSPRGEYTKAEVRMSATRPEVICLPDVVAKFDIIGGRDKGCTIILPRKLDVSDSKGQKIAVCSFSSVMGANNPDSPVVGVVIKADIQPLGPQTSPCSAGFDVIVAYD